MKGNHFSRSSSVSILPSNHKFSIHESCNGLLEYLSSVERCSLFQSPGLKRSQLTNAYSTTSEISEKDNTNEPQELATSAPTVIDSEWAVVSRDELLSDGEPTLAQRSDSTSTICFFDDTKDHHSSMRRKLQGILKDPTSAANKLRPKKKVTFDSACMLASRILKIMPTEFELDHEDRSPLGQDLDYKTDTDEDNDEYEDEMDDLESDDKEVSSPLLALHLSDQEESEDIDNISYINSIRNQRILLSDNDMSSSPLSSIDHNDYKKSAPQLQKYTPKLSDIAFPDTWRLSLLH